jgi:RNA polymerase sigma factor (sigma-70 family)
VFITREPSSEPSELEVQRLVSLARQGENEAQGALYALFVDRLFRGVRGLCRSEAEAEDIVQDTFIRAFERLDRYRPQAGARFLGWLLTIALNTARTRGTRSDRRLALNEQSANEAPEHAPMPDEALLEFEMRSALIRALAELPMRDREVLSLRYGAELEADEVAALCGLTAANVRKICERQRRVLRERMKP